MSIFVFVCFFVVFVAFLFFENIDPICQSYILFSITFFHGLFFFFVVFCFLFLFFLQPKFQPELIYVSAGFDAARGDPLGEMDVTVS